LSIVDPKWRFHPPGRSYDGANVARVTRQWWNYFKRVDPHGFKLPTADLAGAMSFYFADWWIERRLGYCMTLNQYRDSIEQPYINA